MSVTSLYEAYALTDRAAENLLRRAGELEQVQASLEGFEQMIVEFYGNTDLMRRVQRAVEQSKTATAQTNQAQVSVAELKGAIGACLKLA